jgi:hypothetical protein
LVQKLQQMDRTLSSLNESHTGSAFEGKVNRWIGDMGLPPEAAEAAKIFYLAHEGDDLDDQFPEMFRAHWESMQKLFEAQRNAKVQAARKAPFVPGRGGQAGPNRPLQLDPKLSARDTADKLWDALQNGEGT